MNPSLPSYCGIGSRKTPTDVLQTMTRLACYLSTRNMLLRSGGAGGADSAFENGARDGMKEIWIPWLGFNGSTSKLLPTPAAFRMAEKYHPHWSNLSSGARKLHARNCHQVLGKDLQSPASFIICWTKDGKASGGTGQAIRIAIDHEIPVFNLFNDRHNLSYHLNNIVEGIE